MAFKKMLFFFLGVCLSLAAATYRWGDSAHTMGMITSGGGKVRHPVFLESGKERYTMIVTAKVIPPYQGDARVVLEGAPLTDYELFATAPVVDFKFRRLPEFKGDTFLGLKPKDRLALWVRMTSPAPVSAGKLTLSFQDLKNGTPLLTVPVVFEGEGKQEHAVTSEH